MTTLLAPAAIAELGRGQWLEALGLLRQLEEKRLERHEVAHTAAIGALRKGREGSDLREIM